MTAALIVHERRVVYTAKEEKVTSTLLRLPQLQLNDTMPLPIELPFLLYLIACVQCVGCPQSLSRVMFAMVGT